jgi:hypothetical protein
MLRRSGVVAMRFVARQVARISVLCYLEVRASSSFFCWRSWISRSGLRTLRIAVLIWSSTSPVRWKAGDAALQETEKLKN